MIAMYAFRFPGSGFYIVVEDTRKEGWRMMPRFLPQYRQAPQAIYRACPAQARQAQVTRSSLINP